MGSEWGSGMSESDEAPAQSGQAVNPIAMVIFALNPDGTFGMELPQDEKIGRFLANKGFFELDRYYNAKLFEKAMEQAKENRIVTDMLGHDAEKITRKIRGLKR